MTGHPLHQGLLAIGLQVAFDGLGSMPMKRIIGFRETQQSIVDQKMKDREQRDRARRSLSMEATPNSTIAPEDGEQAVHSCKPEES